MTADSPADALSHADRRELAATLDRASKELKACRSIADVEAQADRDSIGEAPLSQETADKVASILAGARGTRHAARAVVAVAEELATAP